VVFVDLVPVRDPSLVAAAIRSGLEAHDPACTSGSATLVEAVGHRRMLLLLDNFEQVLTAGPAIAELVASCPDVTVLATSRAPLRLRWEHEVSVAPLELPNRHLGDDLPALACISSVALFLERARSVRPGFALHTDNAADVAAICARVQGLPLAIELAAARVRILSPRALLTRLVRSGASSTLDMLSDGPSDLPRRQRSLRDSRSSLVAARWTPPRPSVVLQSRRRTSAILLVGVQ
jgi:predicted ATPase